MLSIPSELGGGAHGHLGLVLKPDKYQEVTGHDFQTHLNPGALPAFPENLAQPQIAQINAAYKDKLRLWLDKKALIKDLKSQLTGAIDKNNLVAIQDQCTGYNNATMQEILTCLCKNYGDVD